MTAKVKRVYEDLKYANADEMLIKARLVTEIVVRPAPRSRREGKITVEVT